MGNNAYCRSCYLTLSVNDDTDVIEDHILIETGDYYPKWWFCKHCFNKNIKEFKKGETKF